MQFINDISNDHQKLLNYFNGTNIFASFTELLVLATAFVVYVESGAQFLNATSVLSFAVTVIFPVTKINASE